MKNTLVFYAGLLYGEYQFDGWKPFSDLRELPDGAYIRLPQKGNRPNLECLWFRSDFTPVLLIDVPKEYLLMSLLLT